MAKMAMAKINNQKAKLKMAAENRNEKKSEIK